MAFNIDSLVNVLNAGAALAEEAGGFLGPEGKVIGDEAASIVRSATAVYQQVKPVISATDAATVDAALQNAHDKCGTDLDRVTAELDAAAKQ